jgi:hypothetical protein
MEAYPHLGISTGSLAYINDKGKSMGKQAFLPTNHYELRFRDTFWNTIGHCSIMVNLDQLKGRYVYGYMGAQDYDMWLRLFYDEKDVKFGVLKDHLCIYRHHA